MPYFFKIIWHLLFKFVKECPLRFYKNSHKNICYAQKANTHCICAVKIHEIFVICLFISRRQIKCCWLYWELIFHHLKILYYLYTLLQRIIHSPALKLSLFSFQNGFFASNFFNFSSCNCGYVAPFPLHWCNWAHRFETK